jgi:DNA (cytosine-5)-methyltransferase 1
VSATIGELCAGYGGLGMGVSRVIDAEVAWVSDVCKFDKDGKPVGHHEPHRAPCSVLEYRFPGVPNIGDMTKVDWTAVTPVEILCAGYPCQPFSHAGKRKGADDSRHLWPHVREAIRHLRPRLTILENVAGHRSLGFDRVLGDLAEDGMHVAWVSPRASDVGAAHLRERVFIGVAPDDDGEGLRSLRRVDTERCDADGCRGADGPRSEVEPKALLGTPRAADGMTHPLRDPAVIGNPRGRLEDQVALLPTPRATRGGSNTETVTLLPTPAAQEPGGTIEQYHAGLKAHDGRESTFAPLSMAVQLLPTPRATDGTKGGPNQRGSSGDPMLPSAVQPERWGKYAEAVTRWESLTRPAPDPTEVGPRGNTRLSARFDEWHMGLPDGWVTDVPEITWQEVVKLCGNGVVPQQAAAAVAFLLDVLSERVAA